MRGSPQGIGVFLSLRQIHNGDVFQDLHLVADLPSPGPPRCLGSGPQVGKPLLCQAVARHSIGTDLEMKVRVDWREKEILISGCGQQIRWVWPIIIFSKVAICENYRNLCKYLWGVLQIFYGFSCKYLWCSQFTKM